MERLTGWLDIKLDFRGEVKFYWRDWEDGKIVWSLQSAGRCHIYFCPKAFVLAAPPPCGAPPSPQVLLPGFLRAAPSHWSSESCPDLPIKVPTPPSSFVFVLHCSYLHLKWPRLVFNLQDVFFYLSMSLVSAGPWFLTFSVASPACLRPLG